MEFAIKGYDDTYGEQLFHLYHQAFADPAGPKDFARMQLAVGCKLRDDRTLIAVNAERLLGFIMVGRAADETPLKDGHTYKEQLQELLETARSKIDRFILELGLALQHPTHQAKVMGFENEFLQRKKYINDTDMAISDLAVDPAYRRNGIGQALIAASLEVARGEGSEAVFVACIEAGASARLFRRLDFQPIMTVTPAYSSGLGAEWMGKFLNGH